MGRIKSQARITAATLRDKKPTRLVPGDRTGVSQAAKKQVTTIRFTTAK
jgi:hypothetical protein